MTSRKPAVPGTKPDTRRKADTRENLRQDRAAYEALVAAAALRDLRAFATVERIAYPRTWLEQFAAKHLLPFVPGTLESIPDHWSLALEDLELCRRVIVESGPPEIETASQRAAWCFHGTLEPDDHREILDVAERLRDDVDPAPALALARYRESAVFVGSWRPSLPDPAPIPASDPQVKRLNAFRPIARAPGPNAYWMALWLFRERADCETIANGVRCIRLAIDFFAKSAGLQIESFSSALLRRFVAQTPWRDAHDAELRIWGFGEMPGGEPPVEYAESFAEFRPPLAEIKGVALSGDTKAISRALWVAGADALTSPWIVEFVGVWRQVLLDPQATPEARARAADRLRGVGAALAREKGQGRTHDAQLGVAAKLLDPTIDYIRRLRDEDRSRSRATVPSELLKAGLDEAALRREGKRWSTPIRAAYALLVAHFGLKDRRSLERAAGKIRHKNKKH